MREVARVAERCFVVDASVAISRPCYLLRDVEEKRLRRGKKKSSLAGKCERGDALAGCHPLNPAYTHISNSV